MLRLERATLINRYVSYYVGGQSKSFVFTPLCLIQTNVIKGFVRLKVTLIHKLNFPYLVNYLFSVSCQEFKTLV